MSQVMPAFSEQAKARSSPRLDVERVRKDFPILHQQVNGKPLVYLDNSATTQKPLSVIAAVQHFYTWDNANVHRGVHALSERATEAYNAARIKAQHFLNAAHAEEMIFVRGTTEAINLVAQTFGRTSLGEGDEILLTEMEHHSNIVPWQLLCEQIGAKIRVVPVNQAGELEFDEFLQRLNPRTKLLGVVHVSNALGSINPVRAMIEAAHAYGVPVLVDGAQAAPHLPVDVQALDCDFYAFSGHKVYGPTGIGILYGKGQWLERMPPYQGGGDMIKKVSFAGTTYNQPPYKFEAGTPHIAGAIGLGAALDYISEIGLSVIHSYEDELLRYATERMLELEGLRLIGTAREKASIISFVMDDVPAADLGTILDLQGVAIRAGHHCAMPVMDRFGVAATARASLAMYNTRADVDTFVQALIKAREFVA